MQPSADLLWRSGVLWCLGGSGRLLGWWGVLALGLLLSHMMDDVVQVVAVLELPCCRPGGWMERALCNWQVCCGGRRGGG